MALAGRRWGHFDVRLEGRSPLLPFVAAMMNRRSALTGICTGDQGRFVERWLFDEVGGFPPPSRSWRTWRCPEDPATQRRGRRFQSRIASSSSGRRWDAHGAVRTIASMWALRFAYWRGADPAQLARRYMGTRPAPRANLAGLRQASAARTGEDAPVASVDW